MTLLAALIGAAFLVPAPLRAQASATSRVVETSAKDETTPSGTEGAATIRDVTVEGEDRIQVEFERPALELDLDPGQVPGLEFVDLIDILERSDVELVGPLVARSSTFRIPYLGRPWLEHFSVSPVARFHPQVEGVDRWQLTIANSQGQSVVDFHGDGKPPKEIAWDGLSAEGNPVLPGLTYSYVLEAYDVAGNMRNFLGEGFRLPAYRLETSDSLFMLFDGEDLPASFVSSASFAEPPAVILEAADWINQVAPVDAPVQVRAVAQTFDQAKKLADRVAESLAPCLLGDPIRIRTMTEVQAGAPARGSLTVAAPRREV